MDVDLPNILKRCLSAPIINNLATTTSTTAEQPATTIKPSRIEGMLSSATAAVPTAGSSSREASPAPILNIFAPRARRYSASYASLGANVGAGPRLTPRVSQLRQEECADMNSREVNHEREIHSAMQMSQSWEDLTLVAENWSCKSEDLTNPLQVTLPTGPPSCSSPSPTSRTTVRLPFGLSPSPTRRTFSTRRSMSPIAMRPSQLGPVKRKFELDDSNWNTCSPPPFKKMFTESRGPSPICQSPSSICPSPDSGTYEGRTTPKLFVSKLYTNSTNSSSSMCSSPMIPSPSMESAIDLQTNNSGSPANTISSSSSNEPMSITSCCDGDGTESEMTDTESESRRKIMDSDSDAGVNDSIRDKKIITTIKLLEENCKHNKINENRKIQLNRNELLLSTTNLTITSTTIARTDDDDDDDPLRNFKGSNFRIKNDNSGDNRISDDNIESGVEHDCDDDDDHFNCEITTTTAPKALNANGT